MNNLKELFSLIAQHPIITIFLVVIGCAILDGLLKAIVYTARALRSKTSCNCKQCDKE